MEGKRMIGKAIKRVDAIEKVTGEAVYLDDLRLAGTLYGKILRSPLPHAKILNIDISKAASLVGVRAVITGQDMPKVKLGALPKLSDDLPLETEKVRFIGDEVAAVAATSPELALEAIDLIKVDYEPLPAIFEAKKALEDHAPAVHEGKERNLAFSVDWIFGDMEKGFSESDLIVENEFISQVASANCLETHRVMAKYETSGRLTIWSSSQAPHIFRSMLAQALQMPEASIRVVGMRVGGSFGSKQRLDVIEPIAAMLAKRSGMPVKLICDREEEFIISRPRHPMYFKIKTGVRKDGRLVAHHVDLITDNGAYTNVGHRVMTTALINSTIVYRHKNLRVTGRLVYTNTPPGGGWQGFGNTEGNFALESQMDIVAEMLGMDAAEFRLLNATDPGDITPSGARVGSCGLKACIERVVEESGWKKRGRNGKYRQGMGISCMSHASSMSGSPGQPNYGTAIARLGSDGKVMVFIGIADIGQGLETLMAQIASEELMLDMEDIFVITSDTDSTPQLFGVNANRGAFIEGMAVKLACSNLREKILDAAADMLEIKKEDLELMAGAVSPKGSPNKAISFKEIGRHCALKKKEILQAQGSCSSGEVTIDPKVGYGNHSPAYTFAAHVAEVEVDMQSGLVKVLNFWAAHDVGKLLNPQIASGQIDGGIFRGMGFSLMEELQRDQGFNMNPNLLDYKMVTPMEMPRIKAFFVESNETKGPYGAKGMAEASLVAAAPAIANAIFDAIGLRFKELPITPAKIVAMADKQRY